MNKVDKLLKGILEEEMSSEIRTWLIELSLLIGEERASLRPPVNSEHLNADVDIFTAEDLKKAHHAGRYGINFEDWISMNY